MTKVRKEIKLRVPAYLFNSSNSGSNVTPNIGEGGFSARIANQPSVIIPSGSNTLEQTFLLPLDLKFDTDNFVDGHQWTAKPGLYYFSSNLNFNLGNTGILTGEPPRLELQKNGEKILEAIFPTNNYNIDLPSGGVFVNVRTLLSTFTLDLSGGVEASSGDVFRLVVVKPAGSSTGTNIFVNDPALTSGSDVSFFALELED